MTIKKPGIILLLVIAGLLAYIIFTLLFIWLFRDTPAPSQTISLPPVVPTFTAAPATATPIAMPPRPTPISGQPASTPGTPVPAITATTPPPLPPATATPAGPHISASTGVNIRSGPGTNYSILGQLSAGQSLPVSGQNDSATWWQVTLPDGAFGWVSASVVEAHGPFAVPIVAAPPSPTPADPPTATPAPSPTAAPLPQFQYVPTGCYAAIRSTAFLLRLSAAISK
jgi:hypothetical protein